MNDSLAWLSRHRKRGLIVGLSLMVLLLGWIWLVLRLQGPYQPLPREIVKAAAPAELRVMLGRGDPGADQPTITGLDDSGAALVTWDQYQPIEAEQLPIVTLELSQFPANYVAALSWFRDDEQESEYQIRLQVPNGKLQSYFLGAHPDWTGQINSLAIYLYPEKNNAKPLPFVAPITVESLALSSDSWLARWRVQLTAWAGVDPWNLRSINGLGRYERQLEYVRLTPFLAGCWVLSLLAIGLLVPLRSIHAWLHGAIVVAMPLVVALHLHWLLSLSHQRTATQRDYGGLAAIEKQARLADQNLLTMANRIDAQLAQLEGRVIVMADERYIAHRLTWHLQPHRVAVLAIDRNPNWRKNLRVGDYLALVGRSDILDNAVDGELLLQRDRFRARTIFRNRHDGLILLTGLDQ